MNKLLTAICLFAVTLVLLPGNAWAHVLVKDAVSGAGAVLHVNPDDDSVAGESASFFFDIQDASLAKKQVTAKLTITDDQQQESTVPTRVQGAAIAADYIFPRQGLYTIQLTISQNGKKLHQFMQSQRVSRGIMGAVTTQSKPFWAEIGLLFACIAAMVTAIAAVNRRRAIHKYSQW